MPNLLVTHKCVRRCPYCFADNYMAGARGDWLAWDDYIYVLDMYQRSKIPVVSLLGGEPALHPDIALLMDYALKRGFAFRMFTSGIMATAVRDRLFEVVKSHESSGRKITFIVNVNHPSDTPAAHQKIQSEFLALAGHRASISFNIYRLDFDLDFAFELISQHGLMPNIRLGLTHPIAEAREGNAFIKPPEYRQVADRLQHFFPKFALNRVTPGFDCGFPICMFTDAQLGNLLQLQGTFHWSCGPVVDIGPDLEVWPCFPLSHIRSKKLYDFDSIDAAQAYFLAEVRALRKGNTGIYVECDECEHRTRGLCSGGCLTYSLPEGRSV